VIDESWGGLADVREGSCAGAPAAAGVAGALPDYHVHTCWSDGVGAAAELVARAVELGLPEVGLTDHLVPFDPDDDYGVPHHQLAEYVAAVREAAAERRAHVLVSIEVDYAPQTWAQMVDLVGGHRFDYIIGSVHAVDGKAVDYIEETVLRNWPDEDVLYTRYYRTVAEMAASGVIDIVGHLDLPKKFGRRPGPAVRRTEDAALDAIAAAGVLVEINTSGLRFRSGEPFPSADLLAKVHDRGIGITFGSDAHRVEDVAGGFSAALALARSAGYSTYVRLSDRAEVPLP
jgi:histidinol-phosphatase (PHP family)